MEIQSLTPFWQKFRESNGFTKENTKYLVELTKLFLDEGSNFFHFYTERCGKITCTFLTNFLESTK